MLESIGPREILRDYRQVMAVVDEIQYKKARIISDGVGLLPSLENSDPTRHYLYALGQLGLNKVSITIRPWKKQSTTYMDTEAQLRVLPAIEFARSHSGLLLPALGSGPELPVMVTPRGSTNGTTQLLLTALTK